jgi:hypothetical protein
MVTKPHIPLQTLSPSADADPDDVIIAKRSLQNLGFYDAPDGRLTSLPDRDLFDGIGRFQSQAQLVADQIITPEGPTAKELDRQLRRKFRPPTDETMCSLLSCHIGRPSKSLSKSRRPSKADCEHLLYFHDTPICNRVTERRGARAGRLCWESANRRYAECLRGTPIHQLPPLETWH